MEIDGVEGRDKAELQQVGEWEKNLTQGLPRSASRALRRLAAGRDRRWLFILDRLNIVGQVTS